MKTGYHLLQAEDMPPCIWQIETLDDDEETSEDEEIASCRASLADSLQRYGMCWVTWDKEKQAFYEARDLYRCSIVAVHDYDILDRAIPFGSLHEREGVQIFFSAQQFEQLLAPVEPTCKKARAFLTGIRGDEDGAAPVGTLEIAVPMASFHKVTDRARLGAARYGKHVVMLHSFLLYLKAALLTLEQRIGHESDQARRQELAQQKERLEQMRDIRGQWMGQHKQYVRIETYDQDVYVVRVGLHPSLYQQAVA